MPDSRPSAADSPATEADSRSPWRAAAKPVSDETSTPSDTPDLLIAGGVRVPLDLVEAQLLDRECVLDREIARRVVRLVVEVLVPGPQRNAEHVAFFPVDALFGLTVVVHDRVALALDDVQDGFRRVAMLDGRLARRQFGEVRLEPDRARQPVEARLRAAVLASDELRGLEVLDDRRFRRRVLLVPRLALRHFCDRG